MEGTIPGEVQCCRDDVPSPSTTIRSSRPIQRRRSCDRCHNVKEKCRWPADETDVCERCSRLNFECRIYRPLAKAGRKARVAAGNRLRLRREDCAPSSGERYVRSPVSDAISPTPSSQGEITTVTKKPLHLSMNQKLVLFPELSDLEWHLLEMMLHKQVEVDKYLIGPSFREQHQQAFVDQLMIGMPLLKDAFIACATELIGNSELRQLAKDQHVGHKRAAAAVASLRLLEIHCVEDLPAVLMFGIAVVTFAGHRSGGELLLCRHILGLIKSLHDDDPSSTKVLGSDGISCLMCLIGTETMLCLLRCEVPTIRIRLGDFDHLMDRFIGVSASLLTYFYDICKLSHQIHHFCCRSGAIFIDNNVLETLDRTEQAVRQWQPIVPNDFFAGRFTPTEVILMLAQAKVLRMTALLIIHRLRYAFGTNDGEARAMSNMILDELDLIIRITERSLPFTDLPYLVACFELSRPHERQIALAKSHKIVDFSPRLRDEAETWLVSFWAARDHGNGPSIYWDDVGLYLPELWHHLQ